MAATVATARTRRPESSRARCASRAVAPVVSTSSHTHQRRAARRVRASAARAVGAHRHRAGQVGRPLARASRPAWSCTGPRCSRSSTTRTRCPIAPQSPGRRPRASGAPGRGRGARTTRRSRGHRHEHGDARRVERAAPTAAASTRPSGSASENVPCSLCARTIARSRPSYSPAAKQAARPSGHGVGRTGIARSGSSLAQRGTATGPGAAQPDAAAAVHEVQPGVEHATHAWPLCRRRGAARTAARLWTPPVPAALCGREVVSGRTPPPRPWSRTRPVAVAAERVEPLVGGDQVQRQVERRARPPSPAAAPRKTLGSTRVGSVGEPSAEMKLDLLVSAVGRLSTARVAGSRQPMSTIRAASAPPERRPATARRRRRCPRRCAGCRSTRSARGRGAGVRHGEAGCRRGRPRTQPRRRPVTPGTRSRRTSPPLTTSTRAPSRRAVDQPEVAEHVVRRAQHVGAADDRRATPTSTLPPSAETTNTVLPLPETAAMPRGDSLTARLRME